MREVVIEIRDEIGLPRKLILVTDLDPRVDVVREGKKSTLLINKTPVAVFYCGHNGEVLLAYPENQRSEIFLNNLPLHRSSLIEIPENVQLQWTIRSELIVRGKV